jgi:polyhydroxyalkanoate synthesis repressor PhaR
VKAYASGPVKSAAKPLVLRTKNVLLISQLRHRVVLGQGAKAMEQRHVARDADQESRPVIIKKYANRRLYNTDTSTYVTLEDLAEMVRGERDFVVYDAKTGEDLTHSVLTQIIVEQESRGTNLLPIGFLRQLIRFYGDSMQMLVPRYLEQSMQSLTNQQGKFREQMAQAFGVGGLGTLEDQVRRNMEMFEKTFAMFAPFARNQAKGEADKPSSGGSGGDIDELKQKLDEMQRRLDRLGNKE